jgi:hypothetical protein
MAIKNLAEEGFMRNMWLKAIIAVASLVLAYLVGGDKLAIQQALQSASGGGLNAVLDKNVHTHHNFQNYYSMIDDVMSNKDSNPEILLEDLSYYYGSLSEEQREVLPTASRAQNT